MPGAVLILAHTADHAARTLAAGFGPGGAVLVTPADLAATGWSLALDPHGRPGRPSPPFAAIVTLLAAVTPADLPRIAPAARDYVAAELTAFLAAWLRAAPARALCPPSLAALNGERHALAWRALAHAAGLPLAEHDPTAPPHGPRLRAAAIGEARLGPEPVAAQAGALARRAGLPALALEVEAETGAFAAARVLPDIADPCAAAAIRAWCRA